MAHYLTTPYRERRDVGPETSERGGGNPVAARECREPAARDPPIARAAGARPRDPGGAGGPSRRVERLAAGPDHGRDPPPRGLPPRAVDHARQRGGRAGLFRTVTSL